MAKIIYACNTQILFQENFNKKLRKLQPTKYLRMYNRQHNYYI